MTKAITSFGCGLVLACLAVGSINAQQATNAPLTASEAMIPMRDGVHLYTQVYTPIQGRAGTSPAPTAADKLPILLLRTPYGTGQLNPAR